jgi:hypothetical protein
MNASLNELEARFLTAWIIEDHRGDKGPARQLQRQHGISAAVLGNLIANWCRTTGQNELAIAEGPYPSEPIVWPWQTQEKFAERLKELLPASSLRYLQAIGAIQPLTATKTS